ncbi:hypothetical protein Taro_008724 [Colocasia esculenta]|uniref:Uncharacterized protein n=1 Tax=Colocasia esculenta TaxID=4460 RepID=A0A843U3U2_COLES|nr:hypothetical protein [Colocasia esculenta]
MGLQLCGLQMWCWLGSTVRWLYCELVERQLDISSLTTRLRGVEVEMCSMELLVSNPVTLVLVVRLFCRLCDMFSVVVFGRSLLSP